MNYLLWIYCRVLCPYFCFSYRAKAKTRETRVNYSKDLILESEDILNLCGQGRSKSSIENYSSEALEFPTCTSYLADLARKAKGRALLLSFQRFFEIVIVKVSVLIQMLFCSLKHGETARAAHQTEPFFFYIH